MTKLQNLVMLCIGVLSKRNETKYINKRLVTEKIKILLDRDTQSFSVIISNVYKSLFKKELISLRGNFVALNKTGLKQAKDIRKQIINDYGVTNWETMKRYYEEK